MFLKCQICKAKITKISKKLLDNAPKPLNKVIQSYDEIKDIYEKNKEKILKILYLDKNNIQDILYNSDKIINFEDLIIKPELSKLFDLSLLLDNSNLVNFKYSFDFIKKADVYSKEKKPIAQIILSKIIIFLIDNFKGLEDYYQYQNELKKIKNKYIDTINKNLRIFNDTFKFEYNIKSFLNKKIDEIYVEIIISLIKKNEFDNIEFYNEIIEQLNLDSINITEEMFVGLSKEIDSGKNEFLEEYIIETNKDCIDHNKVLNFYVILFNIVNNPSYINKNSFLYNIAKIVENLIKDLNKIDENTNQSFSGKIASNPLFYYENVKEESSNFFSCSNENKSVTYQSQDIEIQNNQSTSKISENNILIDKDKAEKILNQITIIIDIDYVFNKIEINRIYKYGNYENYDNDLYKFFICDNSKSEIKQEEKIIYNNYKKFLNFLDEILEYILNSKIHFNPRIILELKKKDSNSEIFDIDCTYTFKNQGMKLSFTDCNILANGINRGFTLLINELSKEDYEGVKLIYEDK